MRVPKLTFSQHLVLVLHFGGILFSFGVEAKAPFALVPPVASCPATNLHGTPFPSLTTSETIGERGEILLQDFFLLQKLASFSRERIPERVVHAKGAGAHGLFKVTHDISQITKAKFLNGIGKETPVFVRFSTDIGALGSADTAVDLNGFSVKFYTEEGIHDILTLSIHPFPIYDPMLFVDLIHSRKKDPETGRRNFDNWWDFVSLTPETTHQLFHLFADRGRPRDFRRITGYAINVFKFVNSTGGAVYGKFLFVPQTPWDFMTYQEAELLAGINPDYKMEDLFDSIARKEYPKWTLQMQTMTLEEARAYPYDPFDATRIWPFEKFPLFPVGELVLNRNPANYFAEVEQAAFAPSNMVPGIHPSPDRILTGRLFAYEDAQRYRLGGPNYEMLPINRPISTVNSYMRDGQACFGDNGGAKPNYYPNSFGGPKPDPRADIPPYFVEGIVGRFEIEDDPYDQPRTFLKEEVGPEERLRLVESMAAWLKGARKEIRERVFLNNIYPVSKEFGDELRAAVETMLKQKM